MWPTVSEQIEICLYRVAQESLTNVAKHSGATQVEVTLAARPDGKLSMRIGDNGRGLHRDGRRSPLAFGLKGMTERVRALGGSLQHRKRSRKAAPWSSHDQSDHQPTGNCGADRRQGGRAPGRPQAQRSGRTQRKPM